MMGVLLCPIRLSVGRLLLDPVVMSDKLMLGPLWKYPEEDFKL